MPVGQQRDISSQKGGAFNVFGLLNLRGDLTSYQTTGNVSSQGGVLLDSKAVADMLAKDIQKAVLKIQLPDFIVSFEEIRDTNVRRRRAAGRSFGLGNLASFVTLETIMAANALASNGPGCDGSRKKVSVGEALIGASCASPPGILVMAVVSVVGGGICSFIGMISAKQIALDPNNQENDARKKLKKYAILLQNNI